MLALTEQPNLFHVLNPSGGVRRPFRGSRRTAASSIFSATGGCAPHCALAARAGSSRQANASSPCRRDAIVTLADAFGATASALFAIG